MNLLTELTNHLGRIAAFVGFATYLAIRGVLRKHPDDPLKYHQLLKTPFIGLLAGVAASTMASTPGGMVGMGILAGATKVVNDAWDSYLPPKFGGSNTHGIGAELDVDLRETNPLLNRIAQMLEDALRKVLEEDGYSVMMVDEKAKVDEKARLAETSDTDPREDPERPEERDHPDVPTPTQPDTPKAPETSGTPGNDGESSKGTDRYLDQEAARRIKMADHRTLQKVGGRLEGVDGSGRDPMPLADQLRQIDSGAVINAFDAIESDTPDSAGDDAFQITD